MYQADTELIQSTQTSRPQVNEGEGGKAGSAQHVSKQGTRTKAKMVQLS